MPPKRPADDPDVETAIQAAGIKDDDWIQKLLEVDKEQLLLIARTELLSFRKEKWSDFAAQGGFPENPSNLKLESYGTPVYQLPPSFHKAVFEDSWRTQDVYEEVVEQTREGSKILDPYIVRLLALFHGRVVDKAMSGTAFSTGGQVEHKVMMVGGILFFVIEAMKQSDNNMAQLFLEFLSAAKINKQADFEGLRIYGVLTNLKRFAFYSYDPISNRFCQDDEIFIENLRDGFSSGMIYVTNKIFGVVLSAFIEGLHAIIKKRKQRIAKGDFRVGPPPVRTVYNLYSKPDALGQSARAQKSTEGWEHALTIAEDCRKKFMENVTTVEDMEVRSTEALELLTQSVRSIPRFSAYTAKQDSNCLTPAELNDLACQNVESTLQVFLS